MDYQHNDNQSLAWQGYDFFLQADSDIENISCMFGDTTPVKSCGDFAYHFDDHEILIKTPQERKEYSPPTKRRRVLDFNSDSEEISSSFLKSKETIDACDVALPDLDAFFQDDFFPPAIEDFGQSQAWLTECLNDTDMNISSDDGNVSVTSNVQTSVKDVCNITPHSASSKPQQPVRSSRNINFKGRKAYMRTPSTAASYVTRPFDFIKPSDVNGDVTLNYINQRILTPPQPKAKQVEDNMISAFSGKPVVGKTKIPTRGKGSITIMRTQG